MEKPPPEWGPRRCPKCGTRYWQIQPHPCPICGRGEKDTTGTLKGKVSIKKRQQSTRTPQ